MKLAMILLLLSGCGEVTSSTEDGSTQPPGNPNFRGEVPLDAIDMTMVIQNMDTVSDGGGESDTVAQGVDGGTWVPSMDVVSPSDAAPVCPPTVTCDATSKACRDLCPSCTTKVDGQCYSDGFCVCRHD